MQANGHDPSESIHLRLKQVFEALDLTAYQAAKELEENSSKFYNILNGRANPSYETLMRLLEKYPQVSADYLLRGVRPIVKSGSNGRVVATDVAYTEVPFVPIKFHASFIETYTDGFRYQDMDTYRVPTATLDGYQHREPVIIEVSGNSMTPQLPDGAKVMAVNVDKGDWVYQSGGVFAVIYRDFFVVKRIKDNELLTKKQLTLYSDNPKSGSVTVKSSDLRGLWRVVNIVSAPVE